MVELEKKIKYKFNNSDILSEALTHSSSKAKRNVTDNERLEFLGDRVLGLIVAERLLEKHIHEKEGDIAKRHTAFVCKDYLVIVSKEIGLTDFMTMSSGEKKEGGLTNESIMADGVEALLGAIYKDSDLEEAKRFIDKFWNFDEDINPPTDPKTALQEWSQKQGLGLPKYNTLEQAGTDHQPVFEVEVIIDGKPHAKGSGHNKKEAEKAAAHEFLKGV